MGGHVAIYIYILCIDYVTLAFFVPIILLPQAYLIEPQKIENNNMYPPFSSCINSMLLSLVVFLLLLLLSGPIVHGLQLELIISTAPAPNPSSSSSTSPPTKQYGGGGISGHDHRHLRPCKHCHLTVDYYNRTCPQVEKLVASVTSQMFKDAPVSAPATIRLFFHDCFVEGCDASIMISTKPGSKVLAERDAPDNRDLAPQAFDTVNKAKALLETNCPGVVSCADIIAVAARDFVHLAGGPFYEVKKGRWDGRISKAVRTRCNIPRPNSTVDDMIRLFGSKGLTVDDLVVLSGAHTIGFAHCRHVMNRIYNYRGTSRDGPSIDPKLLKELKMYCPRHCGGKDTVVPFDVATPFEFDNAYYGNLQRNQGVLVTDQGLYLDPKTRPMVEVLTKDKGKFFKAFSLAMDRMGSIGVKRGRKHGEKRIDCTLHAGSTPA